MAFTLDQVYRDVQDQLPRETEMRAILGAARYIDRIIRAYKGGRWSFDTTMAYLDVPAVYQTGTISISNASATLTGSGTAWQTAGVDSDWVVIINSVEYPVSSVGGETSITLGTNYVGSDIAAGTTYTAYKRQFSLASDVERLYRVWNLTNQRRMYAKTAMAREDSVVYSASTGTPTQYTLFGVDSNNNKRIKIYPPSSALAKIMYAYESRTTVVTAISSTVDLPDEFRETFAQGVLARLMVIQGGQESAQAELKFFYSMLENNWKKDQSMDDLVIRFVRADMAEERTLWDLIKSESVDTSVTI